MSVKALINAIPDKEAVFYIKDKSPSSVDDVMNDIKFLLAPARVISRLRCGL